MRWYMVGDSTDKTAARPRGAVASATLPVQREKRHACRRQARSSPWLPSRLSLSVCAALLLAAGCTATTTKHGHLLNPGDLQQVQPGMSEEAVRSALGTPDTTSALPGGNAFYYISSTRKQAAFFKPEEVDRKVVAIYFNQVGSVSQVANYGMKDGRVFDYVKGETPAYMRDKGFIAKFFRGIGPKQKLFNDDPS